MISIPNALDLTVAVTAPRIITDNPSVALSQAREAMTDEKADFVSTVIIYQMEPDKKYVLYNSILRLSGGNYIAVCSLWHNGEGKITEHFCNKEFEDLVSPTRVNDGFVPTSDQVGSPA